MIHADRTGQAQARRRPQTEPINWFIIYILSVPCSVQWLHTDRVIDTHVCECMCVCIWSGLHCGNVWQQQMQFVCWFVIVVALSLCNKDGRYSRHQLWHPSSPIPESPRSIVWYPASIMLCSSSSWADLQMKSYGMEGFSVMKIQP